MNLSIIDLGLFLAATWRLANLFANEEGPYMIFHKLRKWADRSRTRWVRRSRFATLLKCEYCNSVWFGAVFALIYRLSPDAAFWIALPLALSTGAIIIKKVVFVLSGVDNYLDRLNKPVAPAPSNQDAGPRWDHVFQVGTLDERR
jgi:hypothetical protein